MRALLAILTIQNGVNNMHCNSCNVELTDFESTRKDSNGEYLDLCNTCYATIAEDVHTDVRYDLMSEADYTPVDDLEDIRHYIDFN